MFLINMLLAFFALIEPHSIIANPIYIKNIIPADTIIQIAETAYDSLYL